MSQTAQEGGYSCDPYIPGVMPRGIEGASYYAPTLAYCTSDLEKDLVGLDNQVVANVGDEVLEIGFTGPFDPKYDARRMLDERLDNIAGVHGMYQAMLAPVMDGSTAWFTEDDPDSKASVRGKFRDGELPKVVVMHTSRAVAAIAIREFGGKLARTVASDRPALHTLGDNAATVYMPFDDFVNRRFKKSSN